MDKYVGCSCTGNFYVSDNYDMLDERCPICGDYDHLVCEYEDDDHNSILEAIAEVYGQREYRVMQVLHAICEEEKLDTKTIIEESKNYIIECVNSTFTEANLESNL